jgi:hypothetical protein
LPSLLPKLRTHVAAPNVMSSGARENACEPMALQEY